MTIEERNDAIDFFKKVAEMVDDAKYSKLAIEALEQEPCTVTEFADRCMECGKILGDMIKPCEDCISRSEALKCVSGDFYEDGDVVAYKIYRQIAHIQPVIPSKNLSGWIPVSDRLPDLDDYTGSRRWQQEVLITGYLSFDDTKDLFISSAFAEDVVYGRVHNTVVVAWMPFPELYRPESEG